MWTNWSYLQQVAGFLEVVRVSYIKYNSQRDRQNFQNLLYKVFYTIFYSIWVYNFHFMLQKIANNDLLFDLSFEWTN